VPSSSLTISSASSGLRTASNSRAARSISANRAFGGAALGSTERVPFPRPGWPGPPGGSRRRLCGLTWTAFQILAAPCHVRAGWWPCFRVWQILRASGTAGAGHSGHQVSDHQCNFPGAGARLRGTWQPRRAGCQFFSMQPGRRHALDAAGYRLGCGKLACVATVGVRVSGRGRTHWQPPCLCMHWSRRCR
jgi:hypothetical protein